MEYPELQRRKNMETYNELKQKMIEAFGLEETEQTMRMAAEEAKKLEHGEKLVKFGLCPTCYYHIAALRKTWQVNYCPRCGTKLEKGV